MPTDGTGTLNISNGSQNLTQISTGTNYRFLWYNIDYNSETYNLIIYRVSDGTKIAEVENEPFQQSLSDVDFIGVADGYGSGGGQQVYFDNIRLQ